jgi:hypothetical protein
LRRPSNPIQYIQSLVFPFCCLLNKMIACDRLI